jgi:hypothetical protein
VDGPVEGQLQGPPVEASVQRQLLRIAGGTGSTHKTWMRALMATQAVVRVGRGGVGGGTRPQCVSSRPAASCRSCEVARLGARCCDGGGLAWLALLTSVQPEDGARSGAQLQSIPSHKSPRRGYTTHPLSLLLPIMSGQQCLRRLPSAMRSVSNLRAGARAVNRLSAARSYSAVAKASSSGLLGQVSRFVSPLSSSWLC